MALIEPTATGRPVLDLRGPDGNAYVLLGYVRNIGEQLNMSEDKINSIRKEMTSSDYKTLVEVFDREFGEVVDLIVPEGGL